MNLSKLFEMQKQLDDHIMDEHPELKGQDNLDWKILALQVELGECANEWRGFKKWSKDQEPRTHISTGICTNCAGTGNQFYDDDEVEEDDDCHFCQGEGETWKNPLLEEYVDCLHFILSIGLELDLNERLNSLVLDIENVPTETTLLFIEISSHTNELFWSNYHGDDYETTEWSYKYILSNFIHLGEMLGFTWAEIEQAYFDKNAINHERQANGY